MSADINALLKKAIDMGASDLHIKAGSHPIVRINGAISFIPGEKRLTSEDTEEIASVVIPKAHTGAFKEKGEIDMAYSIPGAGRFRCNCFIQRGSVGIVFRVIPIEILAIEQLNLPLTLRKIALEPRGLILVTGTTGSGKSTALASMIDYINSNKTSHIITIEDPIEFLHRDKKSVVNQREIGADTQSFSKALRAALRQDPDVILVGEMRDFETIQTALIAAETGHLVLSTLHTVDASETINRIISVFPPYQHKQVRLQLASVLKAIISMRLLPKADGNGRVPAVEVLVSTATVKSCIEDPDKTKLIPDVIAQGFSQYGMQTFDQSLFGLYKAGLITYEEALLGATNPDDFALKVKGIQSTSESWQEEGAKTSEKKPKIERFSR
ncbi:MAG: type IV pilus twitching motility protein PilT [Nitrospirae bacterium]|nr:type IV pilus twitching motility protein PilT [Nitrospirota bacterium]